MCSLLQSAREWSRYIRRRNRMSANSQNAQHIPKHLCSKIGEMSEICFDNDWGRMWVILQRNSHSWVLMLIFRKRPTYFDFTPLSLEFDHEEMISNRMKHFVMIKIRQLQAKHEMTQPIESRLHCQLNWATSKWVFLQRTALFHRTASTRCAHAGREIERA